MKWETIRSARDPGFWAPVIGVIVAVPAFGAAAHFWTQSYLGELRSLRASNPPAAAAAAERGLRLLGQIVCGFSLIVSVLFFRYFQIGLRERRLPPSGYWSLGARRAAVGPGVDRLCRVGLGLSLLLATAGIGSLLAMRSLLATLGLPA